VHRIYQSYKNNKKRSVLFKIIKDKYKKYKRRRKLLNKYGRSYIKSIKKYTGSKRKKMFKRLGGLLPKDIRNTGNSP
jgi:hypothetical protein